MFMTNINQMVMESLSYEFLANPTYRNSIKQAGVWGLGSLLAHHLATDMRYKDMNEEQKKLYRKRAVVAMSTGAGAGALGYLVSD
jgi:hypothetical protein